MCRIIYRLSQIPVLGKHWITSCIVQRVPETRFKLSPSFTLGSHFSMLHSNSAALGWVIAEQQAVLLLGCRALRDLALPEADCALSGKVPAMRVRCSVVVVSAQLDWMMVGAWLSMRWGAIAA